MMKKNTRIEMICCAALMLMCGLRFALAEGIAPVAVPRCNEAPELAAGLDAPAWQAAVVLSNFYSVGLTNEPTQAITARMMRDANWFYVGMDVRHPDPERIVPKVGKRDARVQGENCVKVALLPGTSGKGHYIYIFRLSAGNIKSDQGGSIEWNLPWRSAVKRTATGWQAMLALPLKGFSEKADWQVVRLNLIVHIFKPLFDNNGVPVDEERLVYSWQPVGSRWWDEADKFARVTGLGGDPTQRLLASWTMPEAQGLTLTNGRYQYAVTMQVKNEGNQTGRVWVGVSDRPVAGQGDSVNLPVTLEAGATNNVRVDVPVKTLNKRGMIVTLGERECGDEWERLVVEEAKALTIFDGWLDRNYYTDEKSAFVVCRMGLPAEGLKGMTVQVQDKQGKVLSTAPAQAPETRVEIALGEIEAGRHELKVELKGADGVVMAAKNEQLIKRPPKPGREWKIDRVSRMLLHNGKPQFVYGIVLGGWNSAVLSDENLREIKAAGFSAILFWAFPRQTPETILAALDQARQAGLCMGVGSDDLAESARDQVKLPENLKFSGFTNLKGNLIQAAQLTRARKSAVYAKAFEQVVPSIKAAVEKIKDHPALMFYESFDEPVLDFWFDQYAQGRELYRLLHEVDGYHPVRVLWNSGLPPPQEKYTAWRDIICRDPYWSAPAVSYRDQPVWVGDQTMDLVARSLEERKPVWLALLSDGTVYSYAHKRLMLPEEQRCQTYLAVIHGASGFTYFYYPVIHQAMWETLANLGAELKRLEPLLAMPASEQRVVESLASKGAEEPTPIIRARLLKGADGEHVLLAANSRYNPAEVTFQIPCLDGVRRVKGLFDGKRYSVKDGILSDRIEGLGTRAYRWEKEPAATGLEEIRVSVNVETGRVAETQLPRSGRPGRKNAMPNPSFEEATVPGIPDYWHVVAHTPPLRAEERTGMKSAKYSLDDRGAYHGRYAFRLQGEGRAVWTYFSPRHDQSTEYRLSMYLKANPEGQKVRIFGSGGLKVKCEFIPTKEWKRYEAKLEVPAQADRGARLYLGVDGSGTAWLDAVQIEQGSAATAFEP